MLLGSTVLNTTDWDGDKMSVVVTTILPVNETLIQEAQKSTRVYEAFWIMAGIQVGIVGKQLQSLHCSPMMVMCNDSSMFQIPLVLYMTVIVVRQGFIVRNVSKNFNRLVNNEKKPILEELSLKGKADS